MMSKMAGTDWLATKIAPSVGQSAYNATFPAVDDIVETWRARSTTARGDYYNIEDKRYRRTQTNNDQPYLAQRYLK